MQTFLLIYHGFPVKWEPLCKDELWSHKAALKCGARLICTLRRRHCRPPSLPSQALHRLCKAGLGSVSPVRSGVEQGAAGGVPGHREARGRAEGEPSCCSQGLQVVVDPCTGSSLGSSLSTLRFAVRLSKQAAALAVANAFCKQS